MIRLARGCEKKKLFTRLSRLLFSPLIPTPKDRFLAGHRRARSPLGRSTTFCVYSGLPAVPARSYSQACTGFQPTRRGPFQNRRGPSSTFTAITSYRRLFTLRSSFLFSSCCSSGISRASYNGKRNSSHDQTSCRGTGTEF